MWIPLNQPAGVSRSYTPAGLPIGNTEPREVLDSKGIYTVELDRLNPLFERVDSRVCPGPDTARAPIEVTFQSI